jgi:hypothetical protein
MRLSPLKTGFSYLRSLVASYRPSFAMKIDSEPSYPLLPIRSTRVIPRESFQPRTPQSRRCATGIRRCLGRPHRPNTAFRRAIKVIAVAVASFFFLSAIEGLLYPSYQTPPVHYRQLRQRILDSTESGRGNIHGEKVFIAANIVNEELIRGVWGDTLLELVNILGEQNVFVSIYENDSGEGTRDALREFQAKLTCPQNNPPSPRYIPYADIQAFQAIPRSSPAIIYHYLSYLL